MSAPCTAVAHRRFVAHAAPSTALRAVPLPRCAEEDFSIEKVQ